MMIRRKILGVLTAGAVAISTTGCSTTQIQNIETFIGQVQADAAQVCKFVPTVATIISLVNAGIGQVVGAVVMAICNSVPPPTSAQYRALPLRSGGGPPVTVAPGIAGWRVQ
jgi:hypothetical protein